MARSTGGAGGGRVIHTNDQRSYESIVSKKTSTKIHLAEGELEAWGPDLGGRVFCDREMEEDEAVVLRGGGGGGGGVGDDDDEREPLK